MTTSRAWCRRFLAKNFGNKNIAIVHDKTAYGKGLADETRAMKAAGKEETSAKPIRPARRTTPRWFPNRRKTRSTCCMSAAIHRGRPDGTSDARPGMSTVLVSGDALVTDEYWSITGDAGEGTLMTFSPDPRKNADAAPIVQKFRDRISSRKVTSCTPTRPCRSLPRRPSSRPDGSQQDPAGDQRQEVLDRAGRAQLRRQGDVTLPGYVFYEWKDGQYDYLQ